MVLSSHPRHSIFGARFRILQCRQMLEWAELLADVQERFVVEVEDDTYEYDSPLDSSHAPESLNQGQYFLPGTPYF